MIVWLIHNVDFKFLLIFWNLLLSNPILSSFGKTLICFFLMVNSWFFCSCVALISASYVCWICDVFFFVSFGLDLTMVFSGVEFLGENQDLFVWQDKKFVLFNPFSFLFHHHCHNHHSNCLEMLYLSECLSETTSLCLRGRGKVRNSVYTLYGPRLWDYIVYVVDVVIIIIELLL